MARFLTPAWFDDVNASAISVDPELRTVLDQHIGDVTYRVTVTDGRLTVGPADPARPADAVLTVDYATATALATGELDAHHAFLAGKVRLSGNVTHLAAALRAVSALGPALAAVRDRTTY